MKHIAAYSGGKDSGATVALAHIYNEPLDLIVFSEVMFDETTSGELPEHIDFVKNVAFPLFRSWGYECIIVRGDYTFMDNFNMRHTGGGTHPERKGMILGFPYIQGCPLNSKAKIRPMQKYINGISAKIQYVGIAADEPKRLEKMKNRKGNEISLLEKYSYTEAMAFELCKKYNLLSPVYSFAKRGGCWFCPNCSIKELRHLRTYHRELWEKLIDLEKSVSEKNCVSPLYNTLQPVSVVDMEDRFRWEDAQMTIFDFI